VILRARAAQMVPQLDGRHDTLRNGYGKRCRHVSSQAAP
jgi:hypothetical protein